MNNLYKEVTDWQRSTFGETTPLSVAKHLRKEVDELIDALERGDNDHAQEELSDVQILVWNESMRLNMDYYDLSANVRKKHNKNLQRKWLKPDADGCVHHEKSQEEKFETYIFQGKTLEQMDKEELVILLKKQLKENPPSNLFVMKGE